MQAAAPVTALRLRRNTVGEKTRFPDDTLPTCDKLGAEKVQQLAKVLVK
jgi:hypothetical protein